MQSNGGATHPCFTSNVENLKIMLNKLTIISHGGITHSDDRHDVIPQVSQNGVNNLKPYNIQRDNYITMMPHICMTASTDPIIKKMYKIASIKRTSPQIHDSRANYSEDFRGLEL